MREKPTRDIGKESDQRLYSSLCPPGSCFPLKNKSYRAINLFLGADALQRMEPIKDFEKIHLNLENCIVPKDRLLNTPSRKLGMSHELEVDLRITGCEYIQTAGLLLQLPQVAMATAQVLFQRFYYAKSFTEFKARVSEDINLFIC